MTDKDHNHSAINRFTGLPREWNEFNEVYCIVTGLKIDTCRDFSYKDCKDWVERALQ